METREHKIAVTTIIIILQLIAWIVCGIGIMLSVWIDIEFGLKGVLVIVAFICSIFLLGWLMDKGINKIKYLWNLD